MSTAGTPDEATTGIATWRDPGRRSGALAWAVEQLAGRPWLRRWGSGFPNGSLRDAYLDLWCEHGSLPALREQCDLALTVGPLQRALT